MLRKMSLIIPVLLVLAACSHQTPPNLTPEQQAQYIKVQTADQTLTRVQELQNITIQAEASGGIPTATARVLVQFTIDAAVVLKAVPTGWQGTVRTLWTAVKTNPYVIPYTTNTYIQVAFALVDSAITSWGA
jgi:hypothetical protein